MAQRPRPDGSTPETAGVVFQSEDGCLKVFQSGPDRPDRPPIRDESARLTVRAPSANRSHPEAEVRAPELEAEVLGTLRFVRLSLAMQLAIGGVIVWALAKHGWLGS